MSVPILDLKIDRRAFGIIATAFVAILTALVVLSVVWSAIKGVQDDLDAKIKESIGVIQEWTEKIKAIPTSGKPTDEQVNNARQTVSKAFEILALNAADERENVKTARDELKTAIEKMVRGALAGDQKTTASCDARIERGRYFVGLETDDFKNIAADKQRLLTNNQNEVVKAAQEFTRLALKDTIGEIRRANLNPVAALEKLKERLDTLHKRWEELESEISAPAELRKTRNDLKDIITFCEERLKYKVYEVIEGTVSGTVNTDGKYDIGFDNQRDNSGQKSSSIYCRIIDVSNGNVKPPAESVNYFLPLESRVSMTVCKSSDDPNELKIFNGVVTLLKKSSRSLEMFGMPLIQGNQRTTVSAKNARVDLKITFQHKYDLPDLFWNVFE